MPAPQRTQRTSKASSKTKLNLALGAVSLLALADAIGSALGVGHHLTPPAKPTPPARTVPAPAAHHHHRHRKHS